MSSSNGAAEYLSEGSCANSLISACILRRDGDLLMLVFLLSLVILVLLVLLVGVRVSVKVDTWS